MSNPNFATDRKHLTEKSYKSDAQLKTRIRIHELYTEPKIDFVPWILDHMPWQGDELVLDVGCGAGVYAEEAQARGRRYVACDLSYGMVASVSQAADKVNLDVQALPFADHTAAVVLANHMLYHVPDKAQALREIRRVLKPDGYLLSATNSATNMRELRELMQQVTAQLGIEMDDPFVGVASLFDLETGAEILRPHFSRVARYDLAAALVFRGAQPIIDYLGSSRDWFEARNEGQATWAEAEQVLRQLLAEHFAAHELFRVSKLAGVFVSRP